MEKKIYKENELDTLELSCTDCKWRGKGSEANQIDLYGISKYRELHCPECDAFLANLAPTDSPDSESADPLSFQMG